MAEYNSLYINIKIREERLQEFLQEKIIPQNIDDQWQKWWSSREMYSKQTLDHLPHYHFQNNSAIFNQLLKGKDFCSMEQYDENNQTWTFISVFFSENYTEILPMLSLLKSLAPYQEPENTGVACIYDFYWGTNQVMACLEFANQRALLKNYLSVTEIQPGVLEQANRTLEEAIETFNKKFND
ncbi:MAG: hypothetical protein KF862_05580 [Chitinophagaceae bacterium]|nr:hypothetical protein [Chitinophagaceae bacterium]